MNIRIPVRALFLVVLLLTSLGLVAQKANHTFELGATEFLLQIYVLVIKNINT